jgi:hypothetical protein
VNSDSFLSMGGALQYNLGEVPHRFDSETPIKIKKKNNKKKKNFILGSNKVLQSLFLMPLCSSIYHYVNVYFVSAYTLYLFVFFIFNNVFI